jgi:hypothetical protein
MGSSIEDLFVFLLLITFAISLLYMYFFDMCLLRTQTRDIFSDNQYIVDVMYVNIVRIRIRILLSMSFRLTLEFGNVIYLIQSYDCTKYEKAL